MFCFIFFYVWQFNHLIKHNKLIIFKTEEDDYDDWVPDNDDAWDNDNDWHTTDEDDFDDNDGWNPRWKRDNVKPK